MSSFPPQQACPRCRYPVAPGMMACPNCGLALAGVPPGAGAFQQAPGSAPGGENFGAQNFADPFTFGLGNQPPTSASGVQPQGPSGSFSTVSANPVQPGMPGSFPQPGASGTVPAFAGGQQAPSYPGAQSSPGYPGQQPQPGMPGTPASFPGAPAGFSSPAASYPGAPGSFASAPAGFPGAPAGYPGVPGQPQFGGPFPPGPGMSPPAQPARRGRAIALILVILVLVLGGAGGITYLLTRPKPVITVTSQYTSGSSLVGSASTTFHIRGSQFSSNSSISFLLDGQQTPGNQSVVSDANGSFHVDLAVTAQWATGAHTLTAKDASGYETKVGKSVLIVQPGVAGTPGPNGAPADDTQFFTLHVSLQRQALSPVTETLTVTGQPDPAGGTVCNKSVDDGQPHTGSGTDSQGDTFKETTVLKCEGTYKSGKITYTETISSDKVVFASGPTCTLVAPYAFQKLTGSFTDATHASGTFSSESAIYNCGQNGILPIDAQSGTWTATSS